jgi:glutamine cyclotransferase
VTQRDQPQPEPADVVREYGPYPDAPEVHGVSYDGQSIWFASGEALHAISPSSGQLQRSLSVPARAGTAFDGRYLYQLAGSVIQKIDPETGRVLAKLPAPAQNLSGMAWAEGYLWIGEYPARTIHQVDPETGAIVRSLQSDRYVTGVTWAQGELWHGTMQDSQSELRQIDPQDGRVLRRLALPAGALVSGLESDGADTLYCGGASSGKIRAVRRSRRPA